jgi:hypothetical protein
LVVACVDNLAGAPRAARITRQNPLGLRPDRYRDTTKRRHATQRFDNQGIKLITDAASINAR